jgi:hypothetical protein
LRIADQRTMLNVRILDLPSGIKGARHAIGGVFAR